MPVYGKDMGGFSMSEVYKKLNACYESIRDQIPFTPKVALVLGSGLGALAEELEESVCLDYKEIKDFPHSTVKGHKGRFVFGHMGGVPVVIMQGRVHFYEGYAMNDVVLPIRLMKKMGAQILFLTNAAGGVNFDFKAGDFMLIRDQISTFVPSPLIGENAEELGVRFPDMSAIYDRALSRLLLETAEEENIQLKEGVYLQLKGPQYESPAEIRMCRTLGADAVGMSTACEAVAANHMGMRICGISCISNLASGMSENPLTHQEVQETADRVAPLFKKLIRKSIEKMGNL
jgi:purine-nucleoside phosphorylase